MRLVFVTAALIIISLAGLAEPAYAQGKNSCKSLCDCNELQCTDFCSPTACGGGACRRRFDALVKQCQKACDRCTKLQKQNSAPK